MKNLKNESAARQGVRVAGLLMAMMLTACGGGGGNPGTTAGAGTGSGSGTGTGTAVTATASVGVRFHGGAAAGTLTAAAPETVTATVLDKDGKPVANAIVTFATDNTLALFTPTTATALTDANGVATVTMRPASLAAAGAGTVTATATVGDATLVGKGNYAVGATTLSLGTLSVTPASLQAYGSTVLSVDVMNGANKYTDQPVSLTFSSACATNGKATLATTVSTNNGTAQTVYRDKGCAGNDTITVSASGIATPASATLAVAPPSAASVQFVGAAPTNQSIVIQGQGGNGRTETATLTFKVVDIFGNPLAGKQVNFTTASTSVHINKTSDTTDASGQVVTTVNSGTVATSFRVQATLPNTGANGAPDISTLSDSVVVTTGLPSAMSLSAGSFNIEGWSADSPLGTPATGLQVLLADAFGNPVPDGTPVVFQTNMGAVGSSDKGGCNTVNGGCTVAFRAQNPRTPAPGTPATPCNAGTPDSTRVGLASICASTTDGVNTLYQRTAIFFSGSTVKYAYMNGSATPLNLAQVTDLGSISGSATKVFTLQLNDLNQNPMPAGSKVEITSMLNGNAAAVVPATVPNVAPHVSGGVDHPDGLGIGGTQGSTHTFSISSTNATVCSPAQASFNVTVTSPSGLATNIPFKLSFTCP